MFVLAAGTVSIRSLNANETDTDIPFLVNRFYGQSYLKWS